MGSRDRRPHSAPGRNAGRVVQAEAEPSAIAGPLPEDDDSGASEEPGRQRIDKWLWHARFFKTRSLAARICRDGRVRRNGDVVPKPSALVEPEDVLTFIQGERVRVVRILALAERRGPATEARALYEDLSGS